MKKKIASLLLSLIILLQICVPVYATSTSNSLSGNTMQDIGEVLLQYNAKYEWFDELYSDEFNEFATEFMLGDKFEEAFEETQEYALFRTYFANYLSLIDGHNSDEILTLLQQFCNLDISSVRESAREYSEKILTIQFNNSATAVALSYDKNTAIAYARRNANSITFPSYSQDCTNFASYCLAAGGLERTYAPSRPSGIYDTTAYWYSYAEYVIEQVNVYASTSWLRVSDFLTYWSGKILTYCELPKNSVYSYANPGDIVILADSSGRVYHTIIITAKENGDLKFCAHTKNRYDASFKDLTSDTDLFYVLRFSAL